MFITDLKQKYNKETYNKLDKQKKDSDIKIL